MVVRGHGCRAALLNPIVHDMDADDPASWRPLLARGRWFAALSMAQQAAPASADAQAKLIYQDWTGPYEGVPPWDKVSTEAFPMAIQAAMDELKAADVDPIEGKVLAQSPLTPEMTERMTKEFEMIKQGF